MPRQGVYDTTAVPAGLFDKCGQDQGWFDRDLLYFPTAATPAPPPWFSSLLNTGGGKRTLFDPELPLDGDIAWELGVDAYSEGVTFEAFEQKILGGQKDEAKRAKFREMIATFGAERAEKMKLVKKVITVAGVSYVVWKILLWL
jgi:hypothetical protein